MARFKVKNFEQFQHYKDRSPPWIKLYNELLDNYEFACLRDASKLHLVMIWLLASRSNNDLPYDPEWVRKRINATDKVDLDALAEAGFIIVNQELPLPEQDASNQLADSKQSAIPEKEGEREAETDKRSTVVDRFHEFFSIYPKKVKKKPAHKIWKSKKLNGLADILIEDVATRIKQDHRWLEGFIPDPTTYLNQERWNDDLTAKPGKPEWANIPRDDNDLWPWAKQHGYSNPGNLDYYQYRQKLHREVEARLNQ